MSKEVNQPRRPHKWVTQAYRILAAGRYAAIWLPEFLALYEIVMREEGGEAADDWAQRELLHSFGPSLALRVLKLVRVLYLGWEAYRRIARD
jgi:hypothetical protein